MCTVWLQGWACAFPRCPTTGSAEHLICIGLLLVPLHRATRCSVAIAIVDMTADMSSNDYSLMPRPLVFVEGRGRSLTQEKGQPELHKGAMNRQYRIMWNIMKVCFCLVTPLKQGMSSVHHRHAHASIPSYVIHIHFKYYFFSFLSLQVASFWIIVTQYLVRILSSFCHYSVFISIKQITFFLHILVIQILSKLASSITKWVIMALYNNTFLTDTGVCLKKI